MKEFKNYNRNIQKNLIKLYVINRKLKETYNECQYYISPEELKIFYEESFFTKSNFCSDLYASFMNEHKLELLKSQIKVSLYISMLALKLFLEKDGSAFLFKKALILEEKNALIIADLIKADISESQKNELTQYFKIQEKRIAALKSVIKNHYKEILENS